MSGETQRRALPLQQSEEMEIYILSKYLISSKYLITKLLNIYFPRVGIEPTTSRVYNHIISLAKIKY